MNRHITTGKVRPVKPTEPIASPASTPKAGRFATLGGLLSARGSGVPSRSLFLTPLVALVALFGLLAFFVAPAVAANGHGLTNSFGGEKSTVKDPEPLSDPTGIAVNEKTKEIDVIDAGHNRVERFSSSGAYEGQFDGAETPAASFSNPNAIAVDDDPSSPSYGDLYVSDAGNGAIDKFSADGEYLGFQLKETPAGPFEGEPSGVAIDPSGDLWVYESGGFADEFDDSQENGFVQRSEVGFLRPLGFAVDSDSGIYLIKKSATTQNKNLNKYLGTGTEEFLGQLDGCECVTGVAVDPATNSVYADQGTSVAEYGPFGEPFEEPLGPPFGEGSLEGGTGIAVSATHTVYVADSKANDIDVFAEGPKPTAPLTEAPSPVEGISATLKGKLEGGESGYQFAYNTNGTCKGGPVTPVVAATGSESVSVKVTGLTARTKYTVCLLAEDHYGQEPGAALTFETKPSAPVVEAASASVGYKIDAALSGSVNPELEPSTCVFQYGESEAYGQEAKCQPEALGEGSSTVPVSANLEGLEPDTTYDYRLLASNATGEQPGANGTFTTEVIRPTQLETTTPLEVTATTARFAAQANPGGSASYYIEYGPPECSLDGVPNFAWFLCASKSAEAGPVSGDHAQTLPPIEVTGLTPGTTYRYWVVAKNVNGSGQGQTMTFTTLPATPPSVLATPPLAAPAILGVPNAPATVPVKTVKKKTVAQEKNEKLSRALKQCKKLSSKTKRKACEARAKKRYGPKPKSKPKFSKRGQ
jgi:hypothetical protein